MHTPIPTYAYTRLHAQIHMHMHTHILRYLSPTPDQVNKISKNGVNLGHRQFLKAPPSDTNKQLG